MRVVDVLYDQITQGSSYLLGAMIESNLVEGKQTFESGKTLTYGQSITDAWISWDDTEIALEKLAQAVIIWLLFGANTAKRENIMPND